MPGHSIAARLARAATALGAVSALVTLLAFVPPGRGLSAYSIAVLVFLLGLGFWGLRALLAGFPRELASVRGALAASEAGSLHSLSATDQTRVAALSVQIERVLESRERFLAMHRDRRLEAEEEDRFETEFLTELSHELRTPLNSILGFASVLLDEIDGPLTPSQREDAETINSSGQHLADLVDDVLDMAALQSGHISLSRAEIDAGAIVVEVHRLLAGQLRKKPIELLVDVADDLPKLYADEKRLRQILVNLGTNALKFTSEGSVRLEAVSEDGGIRFSVHDTGPGIPPGERDSIFLEFTQVSSSVLRRTQGSGLGLAIVKRLTDLHGGRIWLDSVTGEGSSFHVHLPFVEATSEESQESQESQESPEARDER
ncbi:MAG: hypothetical protein DRJ42_01555 [Deltaproteobacteria bacterium]|nr:MAG: hypothetical protein DRJ42_01555 [Deltaproteobacteria bacterium]